MGLAFPTMRSVGLGAGPVLRQQDSPCHARRDSHSMNAAGGECRAAAFLGARARPVRSAAPLVALGRSRPALSRSSGTMRTVVVPRPLIVSRSPSSAHAPKPPSAKMKRPSRVNSLTWPQSPSSVHRPIGKARSGRTAGAHAAATAVGIASAASIAAIHPIFAILILASRAPEETNAFRHQNGSTPGRKCKTKPVLQI